MNSFYERRLTYTEICKERLSELAKENAKLNFEMNQAIFEQSIHNVDKW